RHQPLCGHPLQRRAGAGRKAKKPCTNKNQAHDIFPEYWIIKADKFNGKVSNALDEWIYFLKNSEILDTFSAKGLQQAKEKLDQLRMTEGERGEYQRYLKHLMDIASEQHTKQADIEDLLLESKKEGIIEGKLQGVVEVARNLIKQGLGNDLIAAATGLSEEEIQRLREERE
ncbi:MAG: hypothetical protein HC842_06775, partial [Cytophagales bacterium]|nr:hypothetical protein [Cytophagales bacterium]